MTRTEIDAYLDQLADIVVEATLARLLAESAPDLVPAIPEPPEVPE